MLAILSWGESSSVWSSISGITLYGYLAQPKHHLERFYRRCRKYGVHLADDPLDMTAGDHPEDYATIPVPWSLVHPLIPDNLVRADVSQLEKLQSASTPCFVDTPSFGYQIRNKPQHDLVEKIVDSSLGPALKCADESR